MSGRGRALLAALLGALAVGSLSVVAATPPLKLAAEHAALGRDEGSWDTTIVIPIGPPGSKPETSKGVEVDRLCCGGLWLIKEYKSDPSKPPFEGHGIIGFDPGKKKYVAVWVDSELTTPMISEGTYDASTRTMTMRGSMSANGKELRWREVTVWKDDDTRQFTTYRPGPDGREAPSMSITSTRQK